MTESEWLRATGPEKMLEFLRGKVSDRKLRLFAVACCRRLWHWLTEERSRQAVEAAERFAEGVLGAQEMKTACHAHEVAEQELGAREETPHPATIAVGAAIISAATGCFDPHYFDGDAVNGAIGVSGWVATAAWVAHAVPAPSRLCVEEVDPRWAGLKTAELAEHAVLLRELVGNPFRPIHLDPALRSWHEGTLVKLAQAAYQERELPSGLLDTARLAILADALEEAGCTDADLLAHLRGPGPHLRGCFALDAVLGRGEP